MNNQLLPEFGLAPNTYGWTGELPGGPYELLGKKVALKIDTRSIPNQLEVLPPVSARQAALVRMILPVLPTLLKRVERELTAYNEKLDPFDISLLKDPFVWLSSEFDDGISWILVVERSDWPDFGYHFEFSGIDFVKLETGD